MVQTRYKMLLGTSKKQWEELTIKDDGTMTMTFHGRDREISHEVTENEDGWLCYPGGMYPGLESGRWTMVEEGRGKMEDVVETTDNTDLTDNYAEPEVIETNTNCTNYTNNEPVIVNQPRPRRQRKQRKPRVERQEPAISHQPSDIDHQTSSTMKAIGMVAAATVALFVIYETGLIIPLGLIGLATGGILK